MITSAPLLALSDIPSALFGNAKDVETLAQPWMLGGETPFWYSKTAWALAAIVAANAKTDADPPRVWFPDYFCNQSTDPVRQSGAQIVFYPVTRELTPDWAACRVLASDAAPDVFVLAHYFGHPNDGGGARAFCDEQNAVLIEDAAHVLTPVADIGTHGDAVCYSPHKLFALPDGALTLIRQSTLADAMAKAGLLDVAPDPECWLVKRTVQKLSPPSMLAARTRNARVQLHDDPAYQVLDQKPHISAMAMRLLAKVGARLGNSRAVRLRNAAALADMVDDIPNTAPLFPPTDAPPYRWALRCDDEAHASAMFARLRAGGCPVESWPDMAPEVTSGVALSLRRTILTFPVHTQISKADLYAWHRAAITA